MEDNLNLSNEEVEQITLEEAEAEEGLSIQRYAFNSFRIERSVRDILNWVKKGKIIIPKFQRDFVWNYNQSCKLVESILLGLPIPDFFMFRLIDNEEKTEKYILIDGLQRYTTINQYVSGEYIQGDMKKIFKINDKSSQWYSKTYEELEEEDKDFFQDYSLKINVFDSIETSEQIQKLYMTSIFERINTGSSKLSGQEVRNAIYDGPVVTALRHDAKNEYFLSLLQDDRKKYLQRSKNEEFYLRILSYNHVYNQIMKSSCLYIDDSQESKLTSSKELMLCNYLFYSNKGKIDYFCMRDVLNNKLKQIFEFNPTAFCTIKRESEEVSNKVHETFSEALVIAMINGVDINISKEKFDELKIKIWKNPDTYSEFFVTTTALKNIQKRVETVSQLLMGELK